MPRQVDSRDVINLVRTILDEFNRMDASSAFEEAVDGLLARIACHSVVRGFHNLEHLQISELLRSMDQTDFAASCPHGRPVSHVISLVDLEKIFKRS